MSKFTSALKDEIARVARKEIRSATAGLTKTAKGLRKEVQSLKKDLRDAQKRLEQVQKQGGASAASASAGVASADNSTDTPSIRPTGKMVRSVRDRLGLTQADFAKLLGVSGLTIWKWEKTNGRINMRSRPIAAFAEARDLGKREAEARLAAMGASPKKSKKKSAKKKSAKKKASKTSTKKTAKKKTKKKASKKKTAKKATKKKSTKKKSRK